MSNDGIMLIEKSAKQSIWMIREGYPIYATRKNIYTYDFAVIAIEAKDGRIRKYCNNMEDTHITIACERNGKTYRMQIKNISLDETMDTETIESVFIYFEKDSQALLAFTTAGTFMNTGFFMNTVSRMDIPSLREEAMSIAYMMDDTKYLFRMFSQYNMEGRSDNNEYAE